MRKAVFPKAPRIEGVAVAAVICAAGSSVRMSGSKKEYRALPGDSAGLTVLGSAVRAFAVLPEVKLIVVAVPADPVTGEAAAREALPPALLDGKGPPVRFVEGGGTRRVSVFNALRAIPETFPDRPGFRAFALIHDGARPWVNPYFIRRIIAEAKNHPAVIPLLPLTETPKETTLPLDDSFGSVTVYVKRHPKRALVGISQTPQAFAFPEILAVHGMAAEHARVTGAEFTDDAEIWGTFHGSVAAIPGDPRNRKITFPRDLA